MRMAGAKGAAAYLLAVLLLGGTGCRTFNMTEKEFIQQQRGDYSETPQSEAAWWLLGWPLQILGTRYSEK